MEDWAEIRRLHRAEGMPIKAVARRMGISKNTVKRALAAEEPPKYRREGRGSIVDAVEPQIGRPQEMLGRTRNPVALHGRRASFWPVRHRKAGRGRMDIKTLEELQAADERTLVFTPLGLGGRMMPEDAADFQQRMIANFQLADDVAETTRNKFDQLRAAYAHGVLCYELFTLVEDAAQLTLEQALRDRFAAQYHGQVVEIRDRKKREHQITMTSYSDFFDSLRRIHRPQIRMGASREWEAFNGTLGGLLTWARRERLLRGQRNRSLNPVLQALRNMVAHGTYHLDSPVEAARSLSDLAEIINHLWGHPTPGGRLYPAPLSRSIVAIGWSDSGEKTTAGYADYLAEACDEECFTYVLVRAVFCPGGITDPYLLNFDARSATTAFPTQYLWGPGNRDEAVAWLDDHHPQPDECDYLDQVVLVRVYDGQVSLPMYPGIAAGLPAKEQRDSTWYALRVDRGLDAFAHVRAVVGAAAEHAKEGECRACPVETLASGDLAAALETVSNAGADTTPLSVPDVRTPFTRFSR